MGDSKTWSIVCENSGGEGSFKWIARTDGSGKEEEEEEEETQKVHTYIVCKVIILIGLIVVDNLYFLVCVEGGVIVISRET